MAKKKTTNLYFGPEVELAIQQFNSEPTEFGRTKIYNTIIHPALDKLAENCINTWKFWKYETTYTDLKTDLISFFYERLKLINPEKGKAYSFFTLSARHFLIKYNMDLTKKTNSYAELAEVDNNRDILNEVSYSNYQESLKDFIEQWSLQVLDKIDVLFKSSSDKKVAEAIIKLLQLAPELETFNKKELYILIREHSKIDTQYITKVSNKMKNLFEKNFKYYLNYNKILVDTYLL